MEPLATAVVTVLAALFNESAKELGHQIGGKIGKAAWEKAKALYQCVRRKLKAEGCHDIDELEMHPNNSRLHSVISDNISHAAAHDSRFQQELIKLLEQYIEYGGDRIFNTHVSGKVQNLNVFHNVSGIGMVHAGVFINKQGSTEEPLSMDRALAMIESESYSDAYAMLKKVVAERPQVADAYYYMALALLGGRRPRALTHAKAERASAHLARACRLDKHQAHFYLLWALIQLDYFEAKGFDAEPEVQQLISWASTLPIDKRSFRELIVNLPRIHNNYVYNIIAETIEC
jgi:tetratricopeptide (TPR) repeat protein